MVVSESSLIVSLGGSQGSTVYGSSSSSNDEHICDTNGAASGLRVHALLSLTCMNEYGVGVHGSRDIVLTSSDGSGDNPHVRICSMSPSLSSLFSVIRDRAVLLDCGFAVDLVAFFVVFFFSTITSGSNGPCAFVDKHGLSVTVLGSAVHCACCPVLSAAVAEVHVSASANEDGSLVAQASEQHIVCNADPGKVSEILSVPAGDTLVTKPMQHAAQKIDLDGIPMEGIVVLEPLALAVFEEDQTSRPMEGVTGPEPLGHSVMKLHLDNQPSINKQKPERSEHPAPHDTPRRVVGFYDNQTVSDPLVDSNTDGSGDPVPMPAPSELAEHSTSVEHSVQPSQPEPSAHPASTPRRVVGFFDNQPVSEPAEQSKTGDNLVPKPAPSELAEQPRSDGPPLWGEGLSPGMDTVSRPLPVGQL